ERAVAPVAVEVVGRLLPLRKALEGRTVDQEDVRPAVVVEVDEGGAAAGGLEQVLVRLAAAEDRDGLEAGLLRDVREREVEGLVAGGPGPAREDGGKPQPGADAACGHLSVPCVRNLEIGCQPVGLCEVLERLGPCSLPREGSSQLEVAGGVFGGQADGFTEAGDRGPQVSGLEPV